jgi:hypothetical protein
VDLPACAGGIPLSSGAVEHCPSGTPLRHTHAGSGSDSPDFPAVNSVIISGTVLKQYGDILSPTGHLFLRVTVKNRYGVFVAVGYGETARALAAARAGTRVVLSGILRQRKPNGKTLWEIVVEKPENVIVLEGDNVV